MPDGCEPSDEALVARVRVGDPEAWSAIVRRYQPLVVRICRRHRLNDADAADVAQTVWMRLFDYVDRLRVSAALPGWISTTAVRACLKSVNSRRREVPVDLTDGLGGVLPDRHHDIADQVCDTVTERLVRAEQCRAVRRGLQALSGPQRDLLLMLVADPPIPYRQISRRTGMPLGSIGPTRARLLKRLGDSLAADALAESAPPAGVCVA